MAIDRKTALEILNEVKAGGYDDQPIPEDETDLINRATYFYHEAKKAFEEGIRDNTVHGIIWLGDTAMVGPEGGPKNIEETYPRRSSGGLSESDEREAENYTQYISPAQVYAQKENLPVPAHIESDPDPMPRDLSELTDKKIRKLSGEYNAYLGRTTYLLGIASSDLAMAEHLLEAERARALRELNLVDPNSDGKKQKLAKVIDAEILADPKVQELTRDVAAHQQKVIMLKSLKEIYSSNVERLSRDWTMRQNEWEKSR